MMKKQDYFIVKNFLSSHECEDYVAYTRIFDANPTLEVGLKTSKIRDMHRVNRIYYTIRAMTKHLRPLRNMANEYYNLDLKFPKAPRIYAHIMEYSTPGQGLEWHAEPTIADVSVSINLSEPWEYEGANFELKANPTLNLKKGDAIFYRSSMIHRVSDLVEGRKLSFVMWLKENK
jgi:hypothetical protein